MKSLISNRWYLLDKLLTNNVSFFIAFFYCSIFAFSHTTISAFDLWLFYISLSYVVQQAYRLLKIKLVAEHDHSHVNKNSRHKHFL